MRPLEILFESVRGIQGLHRKPNLFFLRTFYLRGKRKEEERRDRVKTYTVPYFSSFTCHVGYVSVADEKGRNTYFWATIRATSSDFPAHITDLSLFIMGDVSNSHFNRILVLFRLIFSAQQIIFNDLNHCLQVTLYSEF